ncbi:N-formylglutamate amidohydrolase [Flavobacteriaceae bacterium]|nr:N-formylglutamate amidohydrolase [Flavobacteriaceae bacterium]
MKKSILHIPHAHTNFPNFNGFIVDESTLTNEVQNLTDHFTDELFATENTIPITAPFSRVFCDVERFRTDEDEVMAQQGMGATYTHLENGELMRVLSSTKREELLEQYYDIHHEKLTQAVDQQLALYGKASIIDCHSFPDTPHTRNIDKTPNRPDICIGTNYDHTDYYILKHTIGFFSSKGFKVGVNAPYKGCIVPLKYYKKNRNVKSIMIEVNRKLYLNNDFTKSSNFHNIQKICNEYILSLNNI